MTAFGRSFRLGWASCDTKAISPIQMSGLKIVLFFMKDPNIFAFYPSVDNYTPCPNGKCLTPGAADVLEDTGDMRHRLLLGGWFASVGHRSGAPWWPVLGTVPSFSLPCFQDAGIHRVKQHVQCLTARSIFLNSHNMLNKYLWHGPRSHSTSASQPSRFAVIFGKGRTRCCKAMYSQLRGC